MLPRLFSAAGTYVRSWSRAATAHPRHQPWRRVRPTLEQLERRDVPTLFYPLIGDQVSYDNVQINLPVHADDGLNLPFHYTATSLPPGLAIHPDTGDITGSIAFNAYQSSPFATVITADDGVHSDTDAFAWTVNNPVSLPNPGPQTSYVGDPVNLPFNASNAASNYLSFYTLGQPPGVYFNWGTGGFTGTLSNYADTNNPYTVTVTASDYYHSATQTFSWNVLSNPLTLTSPGDQTHFVGDVVNVACTATDATGGTPTYSAVGLPPGLAIDPNTGDITGTLASTAAAGSPYLTNITASAGTHSATRTLSWAVHSRVTLTNPGDQHSGTGDQVSLTLNATSASGTPLTYSGTPLTYSGTGLPDGLAVNPDTGVITGTIAAGAEANGPFTATVTATDGTYSASQTFTWHIGALALAPISDRQATEGSAVSFLVSAIPADGQWLYFSATNLPSGLYVIPVDATHATIAGTVAAGAADASPWTTTLTAWDGPYHASRTFTWDIVPRIAVDPIDDQDDTEGDMVSLDVHATSPDGQPLTLTAWGLPDGLTVTQLDGQHAKLSGTLGSHAAAYGPYTVTVLAFGGGYSGRQTFTWDVAQNPPQLSNAGDLTIAAGTPVTLQVTAAHPEAIAAVLWQFSFNGGDYETDYSLTTLAPQYTFPTYGDYDVLVIVTDFNGESSTDGFHVNATEVAPTATYVTANGPVYRFDKVTFTVDLVEADALDTVSVYVDWEGNGTFDQLDLSQCRDNPDGSLSFDHQYLQPGTFNAVVRLGDDGGQDTDYPVEVKVYGVTPTATLSTTSPWAWPGANGAPATWVMSTAHNLTFTDVTPANDSGLEYHFFITDTSDSDDPDPETTETVTDEPTLALPDYTLGRHYHVEGYVKDQYSDGRTPLQALDVVTGDYTRGPWGTLRYESDDPQADSASHTIHWASSAPLGLRFAYDPAWVAAWPANLPVTVHWDVRVYDVSPAWYTLGLGPPQNALVKEYATADIALSPGVPTYLLSGSPSVDISAFGNNRLICVSAWVTSALEDGQYVGQGGRSPTNWPGGPNGIYVSNTYTLQFITEQPTTPFQQLANGLQLVRDLATRLGNSAGAVINAITTNPGQFLGNLLSGLGDAARQVFDTLTTTPLLQRKLFEWLAGNTGTTLTDLGAIDLSTTAGATTFLLKYAGLTWDHLQQVLRDQLGAGNYAAISRVATLVFGAGFDPANPTTGNLPDVMTFLGDLPNRLRALGSDFDSVATDFQNAWDTLPELLLNKAKEQLTASLVQVAPRLLAKFVPGAGVVVSLYQGLTFVLDNRQQIADFVNGFLDTLDDLAASVSDPTRLGPYKARLVTLIQDRGLNVLLTFAMSQLGLGGLPQSLRQAVNFVPTKVDEAMRKLVAAVASKVVAVPLGGGTGNGNAGGLFAGQIARLDFPYQGQNYTLWVARDGRSSKVKVARGNTFLGDLAAANFDNRVRPNATARLQALLGAANALAAATRRGSTASLQEIARLQRDVTTALAAVRDDILANACTVINAGCFAAGSQLHTPQGFRNIEDIQVGELVYTRAEQDPFGPIVAMLVEAKFERTGRILHLHGPNDVLVRTTQEHPFYEYTRGWVAAGELQVGDTIRTDSGWMTVADLLDTGEYEKVYNLRVAEHHTYFVGAADWGFSVWAHNVCEIVSRSAARFTNPQTEVTETVGERLRIQNRVQGVVQGYDTNWFKPQTVSNAELLRQACLDYGLGIGATLQAAVTQFAAAWDAMPVSSDIKYPPDRRATIENAVAQANQIYAQLGLPQVTPNDFLGGANLPQLPSATPQGMDNAQYQVLKQRHRAALLTANYQRGSAKGTYIHQQMQAQFDGTTNGYHVSAEGVDIVHIATGIHYEVLRDTRPSWTAHYRPALRTVAWRALTYA